MPGLFCVWFPFFVLVWGLCLMWILGVQKNLRSPVWVRIELKDLGKDGDVMSGGSTEEYRRREGDDEGVVDHPGEKTDGKTDGSPEALVGAYVDNLKAKDSDLFEEMGMSGRGEVRQSDVSWLTQPHAVETGNDDWATDYKLVVGCSAHSVFEAANEAYAERSNDVFVESGWEGIQKGVRAVVDDLMGPTTSALENLGYSVPEYSGVGYSWPVQPGPGHSAGVDRSHGVESFGENLARRNSELDGRLRDVLSPTGESESMYCRVLEDLKQLSGDIRGLEESSDSSLGFPGALEARDPELVAELDSMASRKSVWDYKDGGWNTESADLDAMLKVSWFRDSGKDDAIWESFAGVRDDLGGVYCREAGEQLAELLCEPFSPERDVLSHGMPEFESPRDLEFGCPDVAGVDHYFSQRRESSLELVRESLVSGDRDGFNQAMEDIREICGELRGARHGGIPFHPNGDGLSESALDGLEYRRREADLEAEMGVYLVVSLSGHGSGNGVPVWDAEMKGVFEEHFYNEHLNVVPEGHVDHEWPWNSENFQNLKYDELVNDQEFLEQFREVTRGMLGGEQERMVNYMMGRVVLDHDQDDLYERLVHSTGDSRMAGLSGA